MNDCLKVLIAVIATAWLSVSCTNSPSAETVVIPVALKDVPSDRLSYRYEADVQPPKAVHLSSGAKYERDDAVQSDFDLNRPLEILDRTIAAPEKDRILAVYRKGDDLISDFRLDMYSKDGKLVRKVTHDEMAVQFPDTIVWSPDGNNVAFVAKVRGALPPLPDSGASQTSRKPEVIDRDGEEKTTAEPGDSETAESEAKSDPGNVEAAKDVLTFRTEQIYTANADGGDVKPLTKVEGLMYFYFVWAPDSSALAALAAIHTEWQYFESRSKEAGQVFIPRGRPRLIEKNGRERRLDDLPTAVHPVWSPDSAKLAIAYDKQVRIYDGVRNRPTQAAIPLNNDLLISSRAYEQKLRAEEAVQANANTNGENANAAGNANSNTSELPQPQSALPDANLLVSFNPIVNLVWVEDSMLYFETGFVRNYIDDTESVRSYMRWHRLVLSAQPITLTVPQS